MSEEEIENCVRCKEPLAPFDIKEEIQICHECQIDEAENVADDMRTNPSAYGVLY